MIFKEIALNTETIGVYVTDNTNTELNLAVT